MDSMDTIKRLPAAVRDRLQELREDFVLLCKDVDSSKGAYWRYIEHQDKIDGYTMALYDAGVVTKNGLELVRRFCENKDGFGKEAPDAET